MDDKKEAIATRITIVLFVLILAAAAGVFAYQAMLGIGNLLMFDGKYTSAELMFERILIRFSSDIGEEERCCIKRASEKLIALYGDLDFDSEEYKRIAEFAAFL